MHNGLINIGVVIFHACFELNEHARSVIVAILKMEFVQVKSVKML